MVRAKRLILVVEDGPTEREALARVLRLEGYEVLTAANPAEALTFLDRPIDLVVSDLCMGKLSGIDLLQTWRAQRPQTPFLVLTAFGTVDTAVTAMKQGANDFLPKPVDPVKLLELIDQTLGGASDAGDVLRRLNDGLGEDKKIVGASAALLRVCEQTLRAAGSSSTVLILGESGTGKELIAEAVHRNSPRRAQPFVVVNMAAIPEPLVESELFGHVKGAFTHAVASRVGRIEAAQGGTLFIDEIGDFPLHMQAKLLRVLESRRISPVGSNRDIPVDVRIVAATSRPLDKMILASEFREDLYYRLNVIAIQVPPLRQRRQDIRVLTQHFLAQLARAAGRAPPRLSPELLSQLEALDWPGNVRQLRNCLERMSVLAQGDLLTLADLPPDVVPADDSAEAVAGSRMESVKRSAILEAIDQFGGNRTRAAEFLGISVRTLQRKLRDWGLSG
jgi:DNA-binding NtrC family response regulator